MTKIYQLYAQGTSIHGWQFRCHSKNVFLHKEDALAHEPQFFVECTNRNNRKYFDYAEENTLQIVVVELIYNETTVTGDI